MDERNVDQLSKSALFSIYRCLMSEGISMLSKQNPRRFSCIRYSLCASLYVNDSDYMMLRSQLAALM